MVATVGFDSVNIHRFAGRSKTVRQDGRVIITTAVPSCTTCYCRLIETIQQKRQLMKQVKVKKGKVFPYSLPSVGSGADPGVQAVSPQVT